MRLNFGKMNGVALAGMMAIGGAFAVTPQEAAAADKVGCITAEQCGLLAGAKGGPGTGVKDATLSIPIQVNEGTVIQNGKLTNGDHAVIPKIYLEGHVGDLSKYNGMIISIPVQNIGGDGKRAEFQIDTVRDGDELVVPVPKNFAGAHIASLGLASGHEWQVIRLAAKVCDWGTWIEPQQPAVVISEPVPEVVVQPEPLPEPVIVVTPTPPETTPQQPAVVAGPLVGAPRVVTSDANAGVQGTDGVGVSSIATHYVTTTQEADGTIKVNRGWDGRAIGNLSNNDSVLAVDTVYTNDSGKFQMRFGVSAANIDGETTDVMGQAMAAYTFVGNAATPLNGGTWFGVQGGVDRLAGAGDIVDNAMVNGATRADPASMAMLQPAIATNPLAVGLFGGWSNQQFQISGRVAYLDSSLNGRMGSSSAVAIADPYYNAGTNNWTDGMHASVEAAMNGDTWRAVLGGTYDRFNYDKNRDAETCGPCGFSFQLTGGPQTNTTYFAGFDWSPNDKWDLSARVNRTDVKNAGGAEVTGFVVNGVRADLGGNALPGVDMQGTYGTVEGRYALSDNWSMVAGASAGQWNLQSFGAEYSADGRSFNIGARYEFGQSAAGNRPFSIEGRIGYEMQETNGVGFEFKDEKKGATVGIQAAYRW